MATLLAFSVLLWSIPHKTSGLDRPKYNYADVLSKSILFYEAQRSGKLPVTNRVPWRGDSALADGSDVGLDLSGGYYDAGDGVKFVLPMAYSMTLLSWGALVDSQTGIVNPELGNWQEAIKWGTDWLMKAHPSPNVFYGQVANGKDDHLYWNRPEDQYLKPPPERTSHKLDTTKPGSDVAGEAAAALAAASMVFAVSNSTYASLCLQHARELYSFAITWLGKYSDSIADANEFYKSTDYADELAWAAIWLYKATKEESYLAASIKYADNLGPGWAFSWDEKTAGVHLLLTQLTTGTPTSTFRTKLETYLTSWTPTGGMPYTGKGLAFRLQWGSLRYAANTAFLALVYANGTNGPSTEQAEAFRVWAEGQLGYMLGDTGRSFVVGFGCTPPVQAHHAAASCGDFTVPCGFDDLNRNSPNPHVLTGALVGGPVDQNDRYADVRSDYVANEVALDYNAAFVGSVAMLLSHHRSKGQPLPESPCAIGTPVPTLPPAPTAPVLPAPAPVTVPAPVTPVPVNPPAPFDAPASPAPPPEASAAGSSPAGPDDVTFTALFPISLTPPGEFIASPYPVLIGVVIAVVLIAACVGTVLYCILHKRKPPLRATRSKRSKSGSGARKPVDRMKSAPLLTNEHELIGSVV